MAFKLEPGDLDACYAAMQLEQAEDDLAHALLNKARSRVDDKTIEQEIQDKGLTAPRVTPARIEDVISEEYFFTAASALKGTPGESPQACKLLTFCVLVLKNGFTVTGESACVSPENFDAALGRKIARQKAVDKIYMLEGYLLKERLHNDVAKVPHCDER